MPSSRHRRPRSSPADTGEDRYRLLASDYHWFYDDIRLRLGSDTPGVRLAIHGLPDGARVLDAACGIGIDSLALTRRGFTVTASDVSEEMLAEAERRSAHLDVAARPRLIHSPWLDLGVHLGRGRFDAVFCIGSSIAHAAGPDEMTEAFGVFRSLLAPSGVLILDTRDWEAVAARGPAGALEVERQIVHRHGRRCIRTFRWGEPDTQGIIELEASLIFLDGDAVSYRSHRVRQRPFTRRELRDNLRRAGFESVALDHIPGDDRYTATAH